jgi:dTDP-4-amino-4,6-dideoxygalactose transaminase
MTQPENTWPIDSRFPPQPEKCQVNLYPHKTLEERLSILKGQIFLTQTASQALKAYLETFLPSRVALPAFMCPDVVWAILSAGHTPVFLDLDLNLSLSEKSQEFALKQGCRILILPSFFGARAHTFHPGLITILDEAQSFPFPGQDLRGAATLFSFGRSKPLSSYGGGGICLHNDSSDLKLGEGSNATSSKSWEADLHTYLEKNCHFNRPLHANVMNSHLKMATSSRWGEWEASLKRYSQNVDDLKSLCGHIWGEEALTLLPQFPTIFAIRVKERFRTAAALSRAGIQTTWYYYPLNRISALSSYPSEGIPVTEKIASEILILPFQWCHEQTQVDRLKGVLNDFA